MYKVLIIITTYNLEQYIEQALQSVLNQKTNFDFKIIVADDCSNDNTINILEKYSKEYPEKLEILKSQKNVGSLANSNRVFDELQCQYFSFLDGDDYWIDEKHLQKQVDYLDNHPECTLCGANTQYLKDGKMGGFVVEKKKVGKTYSFQSLLDGEIPFVHTSALLVRNVIFVNGLPKCYKDVENTFENCALRGEDFRRILHLELGSLYVMDEVLSVYRIHCKGMWQGSSDAKKVIESAISDNFNQKYFNHKYGDYFHKRFILSYKIMMKTLISKYGLMDNYSLDKKETFLLTSLLNDLSKQEREKNVKKEKSFFLHLFSTFFK